MVSRETAQHVRPRCSQVLAVTVLQGSLTREGRLTALIVADPRMLPFRVERSCPVLLCQSCGSVVPLEVLCPL